ncbi:flagellar export protein FliJ [Cellulomonas bogoriensis]|uniref:Flagellar export protein FliJ n=1 Tax=Cellulomonas bogoriensis 69B4 = DSM 16987 TaxID=1386082 RepID=A0A0A0BLZ4_9CELL|nr:flagellar export protein FliJ [Cellulomonas bogoriensis]KGM08692.1 flagellar export protein FliJ [Cellulomonas bogoriensis 69B4 = DSM 16987]
MSARGFRLSGLLRLRRIQEEQAAADAARAHAERRRAERRRHETAQMLAGCELPERGDDLTWRASIASRAALTGLAAESLAVLGTTQLQVDEATAAWTGARSRATALGKLEERHDAEVRAEDEHLEQLALDEAALRGATRPDRADLTDEGDR